MAERENSMPVWPGWETVRLIGRGSFGAVYEIRRDMLGETERCAMKHIAIPQSEHEILEMRSEGQNEESITQTFAEQARAILTEYKLMTRLNSCPNVVVCHDVNYVEKNGGLGWDIDIRMELLTPLMQRLSEQQTWPELETLRLGKDMARALCACRELSILHRDVKPQNIFIAKDGRYKLGDFGIARIAEKSGSATMRTGTFAYMAPEVYHGRHYDETADQYSLGMVLYWLLNGRRGPFVNVNTPREKEAALYRRMGGEAIPAPAQGSEELKRIVLKCCAYDPEERFQSPEELLKALENSEFGIRNSELSGERRKEKTPETREPSNRGVGPYGQAGESSNRRNAELSGERRKEKTPETRERSNRGVGPYGQAGEPSNGRNAEFGVRNSEYRDNREARGPAETKSKVPSVRNPVRPEQPKAEEKTGNGDQSSADSGKKEKKKWLPILIGAAAAVAALAVLLPKGGQKPAATAAPVAIEEPMAKATPEPTPEPTAAPTAAPTPEPVFHEEGDWSWSLEGGVLIIRGTGNMADYGQTDERPWEAQKRGITRVVIEENITGIGSCAFRGCVNLCTVEIPQSVTSIGDFAFDSCESLIAIEVDRENRSYQSLEGVLFSGDGTTLIYCPPGNERSEYSIPDGVMTLGDLSFAGCLNLVSVEIPPSVQTIGRQAFFECGIQTIRIPATVREMTFGPFSYCHSLTSIEVDSGNANYKSVDGVLFSKDGTVLICCPAENDRTTYTIPDGVTRIDGFALVSCSRLTGVEIPEGVETIGSEAFQYCWSLRTLRIPESVTSIGHYALASCNSLKDLYFGGTKAQWEALVGDTNLDMPEGVAIHFES